MKSRYRPTHVFLVMKILFRVVNDGIYTFHIAISEENLRYNLVPAAEDGQ